MKHIITILSGSLLGSHPKRLVKVGPHNGQREGARVHALGRRRSGSGERAYRHERS